MKLKQFLLLVLAAGAMSVKSQMTFPAQNFTLQSNINPEPGTGSRYSGCWGWTQPGTNKEYAIACSRNGTYWVDVTNPYQPTVCAYAAGTSSNGTWREVKTYSNYCYVVCDDGGSTGFQIFDMSTLPGTVTLVSSNQALFRRGHAAWVDGNKLYVSGITYSNNTTSSLDVYSLATPSAPVRLRQLKQDYNFITYTHDAFIRNDTVFASCGNQGLYVFKFNPNNTFTQLGSLTSYTASGYNHSSALTPNGQTLVFMDEVPASLPIKVADVSNLANIQVLATINQYAQTTPHNPFVVNNQYAFVSSYKDGTQLFDISNPNAPFLAGYFDTYPQGGGNNNNWGGSAYSGQWGCYPYFKSRNIFALDQTNGIFMFNTHLFQNPNANFNSPGYQCAGMSFSMVNTSTAATNYTWSFPGGSPATSTATNPTVSYASPGVYSITLLAQNNTSTASIVKSVTVTGFNAVANSTNASCGACNDGVASVSVTGGTMPYSYTWAPSGGNAATAGSLTPGCYTVTIKDSLNCVADVSVCVSANLNTGLSLVSDLQNLKVYPNPAHDQLCIEHDGVLNYRLYNQLGQLVLQGDLKDKKNIVSLDGIAKGLYLLYLQTSSTETRQKLIIE